MPLLAQQVGAHLPDEMGQVDGGKGIGAFDDHAGAGRHCAQDLAGSQHGLWAFQPAEIEAARVGMGHAARFNTQSLAGPSGKSTRERPPVSSPGGIVGAPS